MWTPKTYNKHRVSHHSRNIPNKVLNPLLSYKSQKRAVPLLMMIREAITNCTKWAENHSSSKSQQQSQKPPWLLSPHLSFCSELILARTIPFNSIRSGFTGQVPFFLTQNASRAPLHLYLEPHSLRLLDFAWLCSHQRLKACVRGNCGSCVGTALDARPAPSLEIRKM